MLNRLNQFIEKWMFLVTPCCLAIGVLFPSVAGLGVPYVPIVFAFMTFIGGLKSSFRDIAEVFRKPLPLLLSLITLHVVLPAAAWDICFFRKIQILSREWFWNLRYPQRWWA